MVERSGTVIRWHSGESRKIECRRGKDGFRLISQAKGQSLAFIKTKGCIVCVQRIPALLVFRGSLETECFSAPFFMLFMGEMRIYGAILCRASLVYVYVHVLRLSASCLYLRILTVTGKRIPSYTER